MSEEEQSRPIHSTSDIAELQTRVYDELRALAQAQMHAERADHVLQPTALVHEAWLRLRGDAAADPEERRLFFRAAADSMRRILIEHARGAKCLKRGGDRERMPMNFAELAASDDGDRIRAVNEAIDGITEEDPRAGDVIRLRFFVGMTVAETAAALGISERSVQREWTYAKARLAKLLHDVEGGA